ncbi:MAG: glutaredoxin family protein [Pyrinomonadaceae bacterium]
MSDPSNQALTLFVVPGCPLCVEAREWLTRRRARFIERDVKNDYGALRLMYRLTRQNLVPVVARGPVALVRPNERELDALLAERR